MSGFTINEKGWLVYLQDADDKSQATRVATDTDIDVHRAEYDAFLERTAKAGAPVDALPALIRSEVAALRSGGLKKAEAKRHATEDKRLGELAKVPKKSKPTKAKRKAKKRGR